MACLDVEAGPSAYVILLLFTPLGAVGELMALLDVWAGITVLTWYEDTSTTAKVV